MTTAMAVLIGASLPTFLLVLACWALSILLPRLRAYRALDKAQATHIESLQRQQKLLTNAMGRAQQCCSTATELRRAGIVKWVAVRTSRAGGPAIASERLTRSAPLRPSSRRVPGRMFTSSNTTE